MSIYEMADMFRLTLFVKYRPNWDDSRMQWYASFEQLETKDDGMLQSTHGNGATPAEAIAAYADLISGADAVVNAYSDDLRTTFKVPKGLTV